MATLWNGRFRRTVDRRVNDFNASILIDARMAGQDIRGSLAHVAMLARQGILSDADASNIAEGLSEIQSDLESGRLVIDPNAEDIHMFIEAELTRRIGDAGKRLHTGRSRNDQVALDLRLYLRDAGASIRQMLLIFYYTLLDLAEQHLDTIMPGYTHLQRAQPVTLAHHLMAYVEMTDRDISRLDDALRRMDVSPLGSGALAGTTYPIDRDATARDLGFSAVCNNSMDGVSDRDFAIELTACLAILMVHLSRLAEEIVLWSSQEFAFIELDDAFSTGSSIMPQKKNPDVAELTRGKTARVIGDTVTLLTLVKGLPLAYNKDLQEDKEAVFDAVDTVLMCLPVFCDMLATMTVHRERMAQAAAGGFTNATDLADYLVGKGLPFRSAHEISGRMVRSCLDRGIALEDLTLTEMQMFSPLIEADVQTALKLETCVARRATAGGPAPEAVAAAIRIARARYQTD